VCVCVCVCVFVFVCVCVLVWLGRRRGCATEEEGVEWKPMRSTSRYETGISKITVWSGSPGGGQTCLSRRLHTSLSFLGGANVGGQSSRGGQLCACVRADGLWCGAGQGVVLPRNLVGGEAKRENVWGDRERLVRGFSVCSSKGWVRSASE